MAKLSNSCSCEALPAPCTTKKRLQNKMTNWIGTEGNIGLFSES